MTPENGQRGVGPTAQRAEQRSEQHPVQDRDRGQAARRAWAYGRVLSAASPVRAAWAVRRLSADRRDATGQTANRNGVGGLSVRVVPVKVRPPGVTAASTPRSTGG